MGGCVYCGGHIFRPEAGFSGLSRHVHLQQDVLDQAPFNSKTVNKGHKFQAVHALDKGDLAHYLLCLVLLQMSDELEPGPFIGPLGQLFQQLLDPVFSAIAEPGGYGLLYAPCVVHLGGPHQDDVLRPSAGGLCGGGNLFLYLPEIFSYAQLRQNLSFVYIFSHDHPVPLPQALGRGTGGREREAAASIY